MGSSLDALEHRVDFVHVREVHGALRSELVVADTENNVNLASGAANGVNPSQSRLSSRFDSIGGALEIRDGCVDFECF